MHSGGGLWGTGPWTFRYHNCFFICQENFEIYPTVLSLKFQTFYYKCGTRMLILFHWLGFSSRLILNFFVLIQTLILLTPYSNLCGYKLHEISNIIFFYLGLFKFAIMIVLNTHICLVFHNNFHMLSFLANFQAGFSILIVNCP